MISLWCFLQIFFFLALLFFILVSFPRRIFYRVTKKGNHSPRLTYYQFCNPRGECALIFQKHWQESLVQLRTHTHHLPLAKEIWYSDWHFWVSCPTPTLEGDEFHQDLIGQEEGKKSCREKKKKNTWQVKTIDIHYNYLPFVSPFSGWRNWDLLQLDVMCIALLWWGYWDFTRLSSRS